MSAPTKPALSAEEWAARAFKHKERAAIVHVAGSGGDMLYMDCSRRGVVHFVGFMGDERKRLGALALHGQPFGFTREDVERLRAIVPWNDEAEAWQTSIADRIEALLPPEVK